jgi:uncharacterized protein (DUF2267 family)
VSHLYDDHSEDVWRYERFVTTIQQKAGISEAKAERAAEATLRTLAERISKGQARDLARDLPSEVGAWLLDGPPSAEAFDARELVRRVAEREEVDPGTAERHVRAVFVALSRLVRGDEIRDLLAELPHDYERLLDAQGPEVLTYDELLERVEGRAGLDRERAERALEAVLETLAERIAGGEVDDLAEALPEELAPALHRGRERSGGRAQRLSLDEFVARVAEREDLTWEDALEHVRAVFATLREVLPAKELSDLLDELPRAYHEALL